MRIKNISIRLFVVSIIFNSLFLFGQQDSIDINNISREQVLQMSGEDLMNLSFDKLLVLANKLGITVDELLNTKVTVGTQTELTPRETPGIISVITENEIRKMGAQDLVDVLKLVPGISFGYDVDGALGLAMRGNWGYEGKILVLLDGQEMNEGMYSTANFGRHYPVANIKRIEIIRGAGSAIYGGYAELGVINIVTKDASDLKGLSANANYAQMSSVTGNASGQLSAGFIKNKTALTVHGFYGTGNRSNKTITDFYGDEYDLGDIFSEYSEKNLNMGLKLKPFNMRFIYDDYAANITQYSEGAANRFQNILGEINQTYNLRNKITITPRIKFKSQLPYNLEEEDWFYRKRFYRVNGNVILKNDPAKKLNLLGGIDYYTDMAYDQDDDPETVFLPDETENISFYNMAAFIQGLYKAKYVNIIAGGRIDIHSQAGTAFSPRIGLTGIVNAFHYKLLYSQAFRSPSIENINLNPDIIPERTNMIELETGLRVTDNIFITANLFDIIIKDPIVYSYFPGTEENDYEDESEAYENFSQSGTRGFEIEGKALFQKLCASIGYSFYSSDGKNKVSLYSSLNDDGTVNENALQGFPKHKLTCQAGYSFTENIVFSINAVWEGEKYGMIESDTIQTVLSPTLSINSILEYRNIKNSGLSVSVGLRNLLDEDIWFIQPYSNIDSPYSPYPDAGRQIMIRLRYDLKWKEYR